MLATPTPRDTSSGDCRRLQRIALAELKIMQNLLDPGNKTADIKVPSVSHGRHFMQRD